MQLKWFFKSVFYLQKFNYTKDKSVQKGLSSVALYIRGACVRTIRISPNPSSPGTPVRSRGRGGIRLIEAAIYRNGAIIGPIKFSSSNYFDSPVPHIHEFGGTFYGGRNSFIYPERSYMYHTLKQLQARGAINKRFGVSMAKMFNS